MRFCKEVVPPRMNALSKFLLAVALVTVSGGAAMWATAKVAEMSSSDARNERSLQIEHRLLVIERVEDRVVNHCVGLELLEIACGVRYRESLDVAALSGP